jgi:hypothetical protein
MNRKEKIVKFAGVTNTYIPEQSHKRMAGCCTFGEAGHKLAFRHNKKES